MASKPRVRTAVPHVVHCMRCKKPQENISVHLTRVCMKHDTPEERWAEVQNMKFASRLFTRRCRVWDYKDLCKIVTHKPSRLLLLKELRERDCLVENDPEDADTDVDDATIPPSTTAASPSETDSMSSCCSSNEDAESSDPTWQKGLPAVTTSVRIKMKKAGLYSKFSSDEKLLVDFKKYLMDDLNINNSQQEVDNVSRFLRYVQPTGDVVTLDFLTKSTETKGFLNGLKSAELSAATIFNYIKNILRFVEYLKTRSDLDVSNFNLQHKCQAFRDLVKTLRKAFAKTHSREVLATRHIQFVDGKRSLAVCQKILRVAKNDFLNTFRKCVSGKDLDKISEHEKITYRYYCEAILVLGLFQRPGAVERMTVHEWIDRKQCNKSFVIGACDHKTDTSPLLTFAISQEEEAWFQAYYEYIRPGYLDASHPCDTFFISSTGTQVYSVTSDLYRLHTSYKVDNTTSQEVRRVVVTEADSTFTASQMEGVARFMAHTTVMSQKYYGKLTADDVVETSALLAQLAEASQSDETCPQEAKRYDEFTTLFPVKIDGMPPSKKKRTDAGFASNRTFYDKWRAEQYVKRGKHLLSHFKTCKPLPEKVSRCIEKEGWKTNHPTVENVLRMWKPASRENSASDQHVLRSMATQTWKGVSIKEEY